MTRPILVTGAAGFIGSHLCDRLIAAGHRVVGLDNLSTGQRRNLAHLADEPRFELRVHDVVEPFELDVAAVYHLACPASPIHYQRDPVKTIRTCVEGTLRVLEQARRSEARVVFASTSEIYGEPLAHPQRETDFGNVSSIGPRACYDEGKRCAEALASSFARQHGCDVRIARIFNTYGPRFAADDGRVIPNFLGQALRDEPLTIYGDGAQTRSFCYVDDLVGGLIALMTVAPLDGLPVNLGNPDEITIATLAHLVLELTGARSAIAHGPLPVHDPTRRLPAIARAQTLLNWTPVVGLADGLARTIAELRARD